jgi:uncharacterized protein (DUF488 family)
MRLYTIGFTKKSAEAFFSLLQKNGIQRLIDIRLHPNGQLAGFTKQDDLAYFLANLINCDYRHIAALAPTDDVFSTYRKNQDWDELARRFEALMDERSIPQSLDRNLFEEKVCCLLCSEATPDKCHRRLVAERLAQHWPGTEIIHLI